MEYVWTVFIEASSDVTLFSTAEKAYSFLMDYISDLEISALEREDKEGVLWYQKQGASLTEEFDKWPEEFGCELGWAQRQEVD